MHRWCKNNLQLHYTPLVKTQAAAVGACNGKKKTFIFTFLA
jgi:hypothetical protein